MATIVSASEYKTYLNISGSTYDALLEDIIYGAEQEVENYLGFPLGTTVGEIELKDGNGLNRLHLDKFPVTSVTSIEKYEDEDYTALALGSDYTRLTIVNQDHVLLDDYTFTKGVKNYRVTYNHGYSTLPMAIQLAMKKLVKYRWDEIYVGKNTLGVNSISNQGGIDHSVSVDKGEPERILQTIEHYRKINV